MESANARIGDLFTLCVCGRISKENTFLDVALHLPDVGRMSLVDVDDKESHLVFVLLVQLVERGNLPAKWRSSITPKYQDDRLSSAKRRYRHGAGMIQ